MRVNSSAGFCFALAMLVAPVAPALAFEKPSEAQAAAAANPVKASETRQERADRIVREREERAERAEREARERAERQGAKREYRKCQDSRDCGYQRREPASMALIFPAG
jgi:flagellar biosynthesis/type III secretory pathway protein FliH